MGMAIQAKNAAFFTYKNRKKTGNFSATGGVDKATSGENTARKNTAKQEKLTEKIRGLNRPARKEAYHGSRQDDESKPNFISKDYKDHTYTDTSENKVNGYLNTNSTTTKKKTETPKKKLHYNYKDVSSMIQRARTSQSAGQAVLKAKRKVLELKRKMGSSDADAEEVSAALVHAKAMERVARKKKSHLELEELVALTQKRDEALQQQEEGASGTQEARTDLAMEAEEKLFDAQRELDREASEAMEAAGGLSSEDALKDYAADFSNGAYAGGESWMASEELLSEAPMSALSDALAKEFGEFASEAANAEQEMLEETMEMLDLMEVVDPHMSEEDLEDLKRKHRATERKEMVKAEMEYLKQTFDRMQKELAKNSAGSPGAALRAAGTSGAAGGPSPAMLSGMSAAPSGAEVVASSVDVAI